MPAFLFWRPSWCTKHIALFMASTSCRTYRVRSRVEIRALGVSIRCSPLMLTNILQPAALPSS